jgi:hypothetical protein
MLIIAEQSDFSEGNSIAKSFGNSIGKEKKRKAYTKRDNPFSVN